MPLSETSRIDFLASQLTESVRASNSREDGQRSDPGDDDDAIFAELEAEIENGDNSSLRENRMQDLKREMDGLQKLREGGHGSYGVLTDEKEVIRASANEPLCVVHFYHTKFDRCRIMDQHLEKIAPKYFETRFFRVFVENVPWLVEKLSIKVLPCVICFIDGVTRGRIIGFEELGNSDTFETATLEWRLINMGVIRRAGTRTTPITYGANTTLRRHIRGGGDDGSDLDLDG